MKKRLAAAGVISFAAAALAAEPLAEMPVNRVTLSTSGLANFELKAHVDGNAALQFPVRLGQVEPLRSLIVRMLGCNAARKSKAQLPAQNLRLR